MALNKYTIGQLIRIVDERNSYGITDFYGININKEFIPTAANTEGLDERKYKVVRKNRFVFSGMQTGRDRCIRIGLYTKDEAMIVSPAYTTFEIERTDIVIPMYFFMLFLSKERDRLGWFYSDGSVRSNLDWDRFCDMSITLPDIENQKKYVDVYLSMQANQRSYERGLDDLKLTCDAYIEELRRKMPCAAIGKYLRESDQRNNGRLNVEAVKGITTGKALIPTKADMNGVSLSNYKVVEAGMIAYVPDTSRRGDKISLALNESDSSCLVSSISVVFSTDDSQLLPEYLMLFFTRSEFDRFARYHSWGSAREAFSFEDLKNVCIPIPQLSVQKAIVEIYSAYKKRNEINERLKALLRDICPILIQSSLSDGG